MRLKIYQAPTIGAAMTRIRTELGPEALILATRPVDGGIEVTAALESVAEPVAPLPDPALATCLRWHGVPAPLAAKLSGGHLGENLLAALRFAKLPLHRGAAPLLLAGPPGAGKTLTTARLATRLVLAGQRPLVVTADGKRAGAAEQLAAFTRLLGLTLIAADEPLPLARALARREDGVPVLIDTPGLNPADADDRKTLEDLSAASGGAMALVLPAGLDPADASDIAEGYKECGATFLVATRLDQSRRLGGILAAAATGLAMTEAGIGPGAADGMCAMTPEFLAARLEPPRSAVASSQKPERPPAPRPLPPYISSSAPGESYQRRSQ